MRNLILVIALVITTLANSQATFDINEPSFDGTIQDSVTAFGDQKGNFGVELRTLMGENVYFVAGVESLYSFEYTTFFFNIMGSGGYVHQLNGAIIFGGARLGTVRSAKTNRTLSAGLELGSDYFLNKDVFVGVKLAKDFYSNINEQLDSQNKLFLRVGFNF